MKVKVRLETVPFGQAFAKPADVKAGSPGCWQICIPQSHPIERYVSPYRSKSVRRPCWFHAFLQQRVSLQQIIFIRTTLIILLKKKKNNKRKRMVEDGM